MEDLEILMNKEELMWAQKARSKWVVLGDRTMRYFQTIVKQRKARNRILQLKTANGNVSDNPGDIENTLVTHFRHSFEGSVPRDLESILEELNPLPIPKLYKQQLALLNKPITNEEIEHIVFQLGPHKVPGSDGILAFIYQEYWSIVRPNILNTIHAFFHSGSILKTLNHTCITLIPKVSFPDEVSHFWQVSLCSVIYKVISKLLVNRLKPLMDNLITPFQNAFIRGRNIFDNILIAHEIFDFLGKRKVEKIAFGPLK